MFEFLRPKPGNVTIAGLGEFSYYKDRTDEYWELVTAVKDFPNSIELDFCAIAGSRRGVSHLAKTRVLELMQNPDRLWNLVDGKFLEAARADIPAIGKANIRQHFFVKTISAKDAHFYEVGFHAVEQDVFMEVFVRVDSVAKVEKDYGCCEL